AAFGVTRRSRAELFEASLALMRRLWDDDVAVTRTDGETTWLSVHPRPTRPLDVWLGGRSARELERAGQLGDGWLSSFLTPSETFEARQRVARAAEAA